MLTDPTAGAGYTANAELPRDHVTTIALQQPRAVDAVKGGSYTLDGTAHLSLTGGGGKFIRIPGMGSSTMGVGEALTIPVGGLLKLEPGTIADVDHQELSPDNGLVQRFAEPTALRDHELVAAGQAGRFFTVVRGSAGAFDITIRRTGITGDYIVRLNSGAYASATLYDDGTNWTLLDPHGGVTIGAHA